MKLVIRSARILGRHWQLSAIAIFSLSIALALGILSLSISNTFLLLPPAAPAPDRLVMIHNRSDESAVEQVSYTDYQYYKNNNHVFTDIAAAPNSISLLADEKQGVKIFARPVSGNYFAVMGIRPLLGRLFSLGDDEGKARVAVMTHSCWKRIGADPNIVGKVIGSYTVVGVTPREFSGSFYGFNGDLFLPLGSLEDSQAWRTQRETRRLILIARLKPAASRRQAQTEMTALSGQLAAAYPREGKHRAAVVTRATLLSPDSVAAAELTIGILMVVVLLVLLIACTNVANLLLATAVGRRHEASIKLALGAPRWRLICEFLAESAILCGMSGALGYGMAAVAIARYASFTFTLPIYGAFSLSLHLRLDATVAVFAAALVVIAIVATGLPPALYASSPRLAQVLSGEIVVGGTRKRVRRSALVTAQIALCTLVLIAMGLCQRSLSNLRNTDPGFSARNLVAVQLSPASNGYSEERGKQLYETLRRRVSALPGVEAVSLAADLPLHGASPESVRTADGGGTILVSSTVVDEDYFATLKIRVLDGRVFNSSDRQGRSMAVIINRKMAELLWPGRNPLGLAVLVGDPARKGTVVGVVANGKYLDLDESPRPFLYYALSQHYQNAIYAVARTKGDSRLWVEPLAQVLRDLHLPVPLSPFTFDSWMNLTLFVERITAGCASVLSALGLLLAIIGLFGAVSWSVSARKKELGIRVALGARPSQLLTMVLRETLFVTGTGVAIGTLLGVGATILLRSKLYEIRPVELGVLLAVGAAMVTVSLTVASLSARRWITMDAMEAVRHA